MTYNISTVTHQVATTHISGSSSGSPPPDLPPGLRCAICIYDCVQFQFRQCRHGTCAMCAFRLFNAEHARQAHNTPLQILCHVCRTPVLYIGLLAAAIYPLSGNEIYFGDVLCQRPSWMPCENWLLMARGVIRGLDGDPEREGFQYPPGNADEDGSEGDGDEDGFAEGDLQRAGAWARRVTFAVLAMVYVLGAFGLFVVVQKDSALDVLTGFVFPAPGALLAGLVVYFLVFTLALNGWGT